MTQAIEKLMDWGIDYKGAIERFCDDEELFLQCIEQFQDDPSFEQLGSAIKEARYEDAFDAAHTLKGVSGNLGLTPLRDAICEIVEPLRAKDYSNLDAQYEVICKEQENLKNLLK